MNKGEKSDPEVLTLEEMSSSTLNDKLSTLDEYKCYKCCDLLSPPIMLVQGLGNICGNCYVIEKPENAIHNSLPERVLEELFVPCRYKMKGCGHKLHYNKRDEHEASCVLREFKCPLKTFNNCTWESDIGEVFNHLKEDHLDFVIEAADNFVSMDIDITKTQENLKILFTDCGKFIIYVNCNKDTNQLLYTVYKFGNVADAANYYYIIEFSGDSLLRHEMKGDVLPDAKFTGNFDKQTPVRIDTTVLSQVFAGTCISQMIRIVNKNSTYFDNKLLSHFECPVCNNYMKPPIFQCMQGHSICGRCRPKLGQCPTCRASFGNTRNYAMEGLSSSVKYPCIYRELGCEQTFYVTDIQKHEAECNLRSYDCPFVETKRCQWQGPHGEIIMHLKSSHPDKTFFGDTHQSTITFSFDQQYLEMYCMSTYGEVFRVCHRRDVGNQNAYWAIQYVGPRRDHKKFICEVSLIDSRNEHRRLIRTDMCQDLTNQDNMFNQSILLPVNIVAWFASNGHLTYRCRIIE